MKKRILVVEDEPKLAQLISDYLIQSGFEPVCIDDGLMAVQAVRENNPALILLDLMLPGKDGLDICRDVRMFSQVPIIMVTARVEEIDRLLGLELGADDYICKPFSPREVVARVKTVLRRSDPGYVRQSALQMDRESQSALLDGVRLELTAVEFRLLHLLHQNSGRVYGRQELMDRIYADDRIVSDRTVDSHIKKLRHKLKQASPDSDLIHSIYGVGYKFEVL